MVRYIQSVYFRCRVYMHNANNKLLQIRTAAVIIIPRARRVRMGRRQALSRDLASKVGNSESVDSDSMSRLDSSLDSS